MQTHEEKSMSAKFLQSLTHINPTKTSLCNLKIILINF